MCAAGGDGGFQSTEGREGSEGSVARVAERRSVGSAQGMERMEHSWTTRWGRFRIGAWLYQPNPFVNPNKRGVELPVGCKDLKDVLAKR
jgi:hypothetical protein